MKNILLKILKFWVVANIVIGLFVLFGFGAVVAQMAQEFHWSLTWLYVYIGQAVACLIIENWRIDKR